VNRIRRLATLLMEQFPGKFSSDYEANKKFLSEHAIFRSKLLRNEVAGYITRHYKLLEEGAKEEQERVQEAAAVPPESAEGKAEEKGVASTS
jgi:small subunit ribosomal protein S17e